MAFKALLEEANVRADWNWEQVFLFKASTF